MEADLYAKLNHTVERIVHPNYIVVSLPWMKSMDKVRQHSIQVNGTNFRFFELHANIYKYLNWAAQSIWDTLGLFGHKVWKTTG